MGRQPQQPGVLVGVAVQLARSVLAFGGQQDVSWVLMRSDVSAGAWGWRQMPQLHKITAPSALCGAWLEPAGLRRYQPCG